MNTDYVHLLLGDITKVACDAIVNAANSSLLGGGGVDGAIHHAAGPGLLDECKTLGGCETGNAKITAAYKLPSKYVIHAVGPVYRGGKYGEAALLSSAYENSMRYVTARSLSSIAFPAISTGVYGYPKDEACSVALRTVLSFCYKNMVYPDIYFVLFDNINYSYYEKELKNVSECDMNDLRNK
ncbi:MAG: O-acetyl-ADP-ribose deacetylase [Spirochaetota bacterium]